MVYTAGRFMFQRLPVLFVRVFCHSFKQCDHLALGRGSWSVCFSCICLFVLYVLVFVMFLCLFVSGFGCGLSVWHSLDLSINFFYMLLIIFETNVALIEALPEPGWDYLPISIVLRFGARLEMKMLRIVNFARIICPDKSGARTVSRSFDITRLTFSN